MQQASPPGPDQLVPEKKSKVKAALTCFLIVFAVLMVAPLLGVDPLDALGDADTKTSTPPVDVPSAVDDTASGSSNGMTAEMILDTMPASTIAEFCYYVTWPLITTPLSTSSPRDMGPGGHHRPRRSSMKR
jgi:hypothetical protein